MKGIKQKAFRWVLVCAVWLVLAAMWSGPHQKALAAEAVAGGAITGTDVAIAENRAVWVQAQAGGETKIMTRNLLTGEERVVAGGMSRKQAPVTNGRWIIWADKNTQATASANWDIIAFDLEAGERRVLNPDPGAYANPSLDGSQVVWFDLAGFGVIHHYDLDQERWRPLGQGRYPVIKNGQVVFKNERDGGLSKIDLITNERTELIVPGGGQFVSLFDYNGRYVMWKEGNAQGESKMVLLDATDSNAIPEDLTAYSLKTVEYPLLQLGEARGIWLENTAGQPLVKGINLDTAAVYTVAEASGGERILGLSGDHLLLALADGQLVKQEVAPKQETGPSPGGSSSAGGAASGTGSSKAAEQMIGPKGGKLSAGDGGVELTVPPGALAGETLVGLAWAGDSGGHLQALAAMGRSKLAGPWEVKSAESFAVAAVLSFAVDSTGLTAADWDKTAVYRYDGKTGTWLYAAGGLTSGGRFETTVAGAGYYAVLRNGTPFRDMDRHWGKTAVEWLAMHSIADGMEEGLFKPEEPLTRAQFVKLLLEAGISPKGGVAQVAASPVGFRDVGEEHWAIAWIDRASAAGLADGVGEGRFEPDRPLTRSEMMALLVRAADARQEAESLQKTAASTLLSSYADREELASWALPYAALAVQKGWMEGDGGRLRPGAQTTRAEAAAVLYRLLQNRH
ncbi:MAG: hypothetical protein K0Q90_1016 [Paenibacillaceae bacterium]|jgi:hypothetical protein|nr:hypothetical protein [Paenibacillaceae bacterium]